VDGDHQVIVAIGVSNQASDAVHLLPMLGRIEANTGRLPTALIADAGYCSTANLVACERRGLNAYISTSREQHGTNIRPSTGPLPRSLDGRGRMDRKLRSKVGQAIYALRETRVEPVYGQIKGAKGWIASNYVIWKRRMGSDGHHPQPPETVQGIPGDGLRGLSPCMLLHRSRGLLTC
jgi:hypothetical protein